MTRWVVDASVAVKWLLPEIHSAQAERLVTPQNGLLAPALLQAEVGNALVKRIRAGELQRGEAAGILDDFRRLSLVYFPIEPLLEAAFELAVWHHSSLYDCLYLALALHENIRLVTADRRFYDVVERSPQASAIAWIEDAA